MLLCLVQYLFPIAEIFIYNSLLTTLMVNTNPHKLISVLNTLSGRQEEVERLKEGLPKDHHPYTDKYFVRARQILAADGMNPIVRYQIFLRGEAMRVFGINEAIAVIDKYTPLRQNGGQIWAIPEGAKINESDPKEPVMVLEGHIQDLIEAETMYLGAISAASSQKVNIRALEASARDIVEAAGGIPVTYFGARHFHYTLDSTIASLCHEAGMASTSTDIGGHAWGAKGTGTIPHALVVAYNSTKEAAMAFDRHMPKEIPRIALIDTFNREVEDSIETADALDGKLSAVRIDTCGENISQFADAVPLSELEGLNWTYKTGRGVTISAVWALRRMLDMQGHEGVGIFVSSGFEAKKTKAFADANRAYQQKYGHPLISGIGSGSLGAYLNFATSDIVGVQENGIWVPRSKAGRGFTESSRLLPFYEGDANV
jgi:nicotinate phosphoribosyltransferase